MKFLKKVGIISVCFTFIGGLAVFCGKKSPEPPPPPPPPESGSSSLTFFQINNVISSPIGSRNIQSVILKNTGEVSATNVLLEVRVQADQQVFEVTENQCMSVQVAPKDSCEFKLSYIPGAAAKGDAILIARYQDEAASTSKEARVIIHYTGYPHTIEAGLVFDKSTNSITTKKGETSIQTVVVQNQSKSEAAKITSITGLNPPLSISNDPPSGSVTGDKRCTGNTILSGAEKCFMTLKLDGNHPNDLAGESTLRLNYMAQDQAKHVLQTIHYLITEEIDCEEHPDAPGCETPGPGLPIEFTYACDGMRGNCPIASNAYGTEHMAKSYDAAAYACIDLSAGSDLWKLQEAAYKKRANKQPDEKIIFGVGAYGLDEDHELGKCFKMDLPSGISVIAQVLDTGGDVRDNQFDLQVMGGGVGVCNALTKEANGGGASAPNAPLYDGTLAVWGDDMMGVASRTDCANLPIRPHIAIREESTQQTTPALCQAAYDVGARLEDGRNPIINKTCRVACPSEIYTITGLRKADDDTFTEECRGKGSLTRTYDGCKLTASWQDNLKDLGIDPKWPVAIPCGPDGVTRVDMKAVQQPPEGLKGCYFRNSNGIIGEACGEPGSYCQESKTNCNVDCTKDNKGNPIDCKTKGCCEWFGI